MRLVQPIASIDNSHSESAFWGVMVCIILSVFFVGGFGTWATSVVVGGHTDQVESRYEHDVHLKILDACDNEVDENTVDCVRQLDEYLGVTDTEVPE